MESRYYQGPFPAGGDPQGYQQPYGGFNAPQHAPQPVGNAPQGYAYPFRDQHIPPERPYAPVPPQALPPQPRQPGYWAHGAVPNSFVDPAGGHVRQPHTTMPTPQHAGYGIRMSEPNNRAAPRSAPFNTHAPPPNVAPSRADDTFVVDGLVPPLGGHLPIDLSNSQDQHDVDAEKLWYSLSEEDRRFLTDQFFGSQRVDADRPGMPHAASGNSNKRKGKSQPQVGDLPNDRGPSASSKPASGAHQRKFRAQCEEVPDEDMMRDQAYSAGASGRGAGNAKGKERAAEPGPSMPPFGGPTSPMPPRTSSGETHIGVVLLDSLNRLETRLERVENVVTQGGRYGGTQTAAPPQGDGSKKKDGVDSQDIREGAGGDEEDEGSHDESDEDDEDDGDSSEDTVVKYWKGVLAKYVRHHMDRKLLKIKSLKQLPAKYAPLTRAEIKDYEAHGGDFITADNYRVDFVQGWKTFNLNKEAREFTIRDFKSALDGGTYVDPPIPGAFRTTKHVTRAVDGHMKHMRTKYREFTHEETPEFLLKLKKEKERKRCTTRKHTTLRVRRRTIDRHDLAQMRRLYKKLKGGHMSGDEAVVEERSDKQTHPRKYHIIDAAWQSREFAQHSRMLDEWNIEDWKHTLSDRQPGGNQPRQRIALEKPRVVGSSAPKGLWRNCYNRKWLKKLKPHVRAGLRIINEDFDFTLPTYSTPPDLAGDDFGLSDTDSSDQEME